VSKNEWYQAKSNEVDRKTEVPGAVCTNAATLLTVRTLYLILSPQRFSQLKAFRDETGRGDSTNTRAILFVTMVIMFALSTIYWVMSVVVTFLVIRAWFSELDLTAHPPPN